MSEKLNGIPRNGTIAIRGPERNPRDPFGDFLVPDLRLPAGPQRYRLDDGTEGVSPESAPTSSSTETGNAAEFFLVLSPTATERFRHDMAACLRVDERYTPEPAKDPE